MATGPTLVSEKLDQAAEIPRERLWRHTFESGIWDSSGTHVVLFQNKNPRFYGGFADRLADAAEPFWGHVRDALLSASS